MSTLDQKTISRMFHDAGMLVLADRAMPINDDLLVACVKDIRDLIEEINRLSQELAAVKRHRDQLLCEVDTLQCDLASEFGWDTHGKTFIECARDLKAELAAIKCDIPTLHQRKCRGCGKTHYHADDHGTAVWCPECYSRDTRIVDSILKEPKT